MDNYPKTPEDKSKKLPDFLDDLQKNYDQTIDGKLQRLEHLIESLENDPTKQTLSALQKESHKIAGSAGSYGYSGVSKLCKKLEIDLSTKVDSEATISVAWVGSLKDWLKGVRAAFRAPSLQTPSSETTVHLGGVFSIYLVDDDIEFLHLIEATAHVKGVKIKIESDPVRALKELSDKQFSPNILLVDNLFANSDLSGYDLIKAFRNAHESDFSTLIAMVTCKGELQERIKATEKGVELFIEKPVSGAVVLETLGEAYFAYKPYVFKILFVDDDPNICQLTKRLLEEIGGHVKTLTEGKELLRTLHSFDPDLLILDLGLPDYNGLDLVKILRSDHRYKNLSIIILSGSDEPQTIEKAYELNIEDFILKPIEKKILQARVQNLLQKSVRLFSNKGRDPLTGVYSYDSFANLVQEVLKKNVPLEEDVFAVLKVNYSRQLVSGNEKQKPPEEALRHIGKKLIQSFRRIDVVGRWSDDQFAFFLPHIGKTQAQFILANLIENIRQEGILSPKEDPYFSFICSIATYPDDGLTLEQLSERSHTLIDTPVSEALINRSGQSSVDAIAMDSSTTTEVLLIDDDKDLQSLLRYAFEARGFRTVSALSGEKALQILAERDSDSQPKLIILDRDMPDIDGLHILKEAKKRFFDLAPVLFLSGKSSEEDVLMGLKEGAVDYISKPFSLPILMEKSLRLLLK